MGYDLLVECQPGRLNTMVDALSRQDFEAAGSLCALTSPRFSLFEDIRAALETDLAVLALCDEVMAGQRGPPWIVANGLLLFNNRIYISGTSPVFPSILLSIHEKWHDGVRRHCTA